MSTSSSQFPTLPISNIIFPTSPLAIAALDYTKEHTSPATVNHCLRSAYWALIIYKKSADLFNTTLDIEVVLIAIILHDMGWATTRELLSRDKRFEVDGAELGREFLKAQLGQADSGSWDAHRLQLLWDAIALHTLPSIARYKQPEVSLTNTGILADFAGPDFPGGSITVDEYREVVTAFPRIGFRDELVQIMCGLCREKPETTYDNFVSGFGKEFGIDGQGGGKEEYSKEWEEKQAVWICLNGLDKSKEYEN